MKKSNLYLLLSSFVALGIFGLNSAAHASNDIQLISPPMEQQSFQIAAASTANYNTSNEAIQAQIKAKKENILNKIQSLRNSSNISQAPKTTAVTTLDSNPRQLYALTRMLDYSPHPTIEKILQDKPVLYNGRNYYFTVTYNEGWKEISEQEAYLNSICFTFDVFENGNKVRNLTTPKVSLDPKKLKKGQAIGIAEVSPFKFIVKVDEITSTSKGITVLVFKLELIG